MKEYLASFFKGEKKYEMQIVDDELSLSFGEILKRICTHAWSPFIFKYVVNFLTKRKKYVTGKYRSSETSISTDFLVLDIDSGLTLESAKIICDEKELKYCIGLTKSHQKQKEKAPPCDRFRVVIFLNRTINSLNEYSHIWKYGNILFKKEIDTQCCDLARFYFPCTTIYDSNENGFPLDVDEILTVSSKFKKVDLQSCATNFTNMQPRGVLRNETEKFLSLGRSADIKKQWHLPFIKAAADLRDQNYTKEEAINLLSLSAKFELGYLDSTDLYQIDDMYSRPKQSSLRTPLNSLKTSEKNSHQIPEISENAFYGPVGDLIRRIEPHTEADPVGILIQVLTLLGIVFGRTRYFLVEESRHYLNLYAVMVGDTAGGRKGTGFARALSLLKEIDSNWFQNCFVSGGLASGEGLIHAVRDFKKSNGSKGQKDDPGVTDKRLLVYEGEFASPLKVINKDTSTLSPLLRNAWDSGNLRNLSKMNPEKATNAHIGLIGHITLPELKKNLTDTEMCNGFANRIIWVIVKRKKVLPFGGDFQIEHAADLKNTFDEILKFAKGERQVVFSKDAAVLWETLYYAIAETKKEGMYGAITARAEAIILRLSMIFATCDLSDEIKIEHLEAAKAIWDYSEKCCQSMFGNNLGDSSADVLLTAISNPPYKISRTKIRDLFQKNKSSAEIERLISILEENNLAYRAYEIINGNTTEFLIKSDLNIKNDLVEIQNDVH